MQAEEPEVRDRALTLNVESRGIEPSGGRMSSGGDSSLPRTTVIAIIVSAVVAVVIFVALAAFFWKKQREEAQGDYEDVRPPPPTQHQTSRPPQLSITFIHPTTLDVCMSASSGAGRVVHIPP